MRNNTVKKLVAGTMAAAMTVGCSVSAMAASNGGGATGTGTKLDHVNQNVVNVVFPVVPANTEQFNYTVDAEGLIQAADQNFKGAKVKLPGSTDSHVYFISKARVDVYTPATLTSDFEADTQYYTKDADAYEQVASGAEFDSNQTYYTSTDGTTFTVANNITEFAANTDYYTLKPATYTAVSASDTYTTGTTYYTMEPGVAEYANSSTELTVTNKSNVPVEISATAKATLASGTMMTLVSDPSEAKGDDAKLYLGIRVGNNETAVTTAGATAKEKVAGSADNFELVSLANGKFEYQEKADATEWYSTKISLTGAVNVVKDSGNAIAPTVEITWAYSSGDKAPEVLGTSFTYDHTKDLVIPVSLGSGSLAATKVAKFQFLGASGNWADCTEGTHYVFENNAVVFKAGLWANAAGTSKQMRVIFNDSAETTSDPFTVAIK